MTANHASDIPMLDLAERFQFLQGARRRFKTIGDEALFNQRTKKSAWVMSSQLKQRCAQGSETVVLNSKPNN